MRTASGEPTATCSPRVNEEQRELPHLAGDCSPLHNALSSVVEHAMSRVSARGDRCDLGEELKSRRGAPIEVTVNRLLNAVVPAVDPRARARDDLVRLAPDVMSNTRNETGGAVSLDTRRRFGARRIGHRARVAMRLGVAASRRKAVRPVEKPHTLSCPAAS